MAGETDIITRLVKKVFERYEEIKLFAFEEFEEYFDFQYEKSVFSQFFLGWLIFEFQYIGGKRLLPLIKESFSLSEKEKDMIRRLEDGVVGEFSVLEQKDNTIKVQDEITKKTYIVHTIDLPKIRSNTIYAKLVKNFNENYFFFGGILQTNTE